MRLFWGNEIVKGTAFRWTYAYTRAHAYLEEPNDINERMSDTKIHVNNIRKNRNANQRRMFFCDIEATLIISHNKQERKGKKRKSEWKRGREKHDSNLEIISFFPSSLWTWLFSICGRCSSFKVFWLFRCSFWSKPPRISTQTTKNLFFSLKERLSSFNVSLTRALSMFPCLQASKINDRNILQFMWHVSSKSLKKNELQKKTRNLNWWSSHIYSKRSLYSSDVVFHKCYNLHSISTMNLKMTPPNKS